MKKYDLDETKIKKIARLCVQEQGCIAGVKAEASQAANLLETNAAYRSEYGSDIYSFMRNSQWYANAAHYMDYGSASSAAVDAVKDVLCNASRVFPQYIDEHDDIRDIEYIKLNGEKVSKTNRANYKKGQTIIKNSMGSIYTFWCFPAEGCDPFGYTQKAYDYVKEHGGSGEAGVSPDKVIEVAAAEVGYLEKKSAKDLDSKTANAGDKNFTKYARDLYPDLQGQAWCDMFVDWVFVKAYGKATAKKLLGGFSAYTPDSAQYFKDRKQWHPGNPKKGDVIFFENSERICHTGIVYKVDDTTVYTIEGNTSAGEQVIPNGGGVCKKSYKLYNSRIAGYGRPEYSAADGSSEPEPEKVEKIWVKSQLPEISKGDCGNAVIVWQIIVGVDPDGDFGSRTLNATVNFQTAHGLKGDGIVGQKTWAAGLSDIECS